MTPDHSSKSPPNWLAESLAVAIVADTLHLSMNEAAWLRARFQAGKSPYHWRVIYLYLKSRCHGYKP